MKLFYFSDAFRCAVQSETKSESNTSEVFDGVCSP